MSDDKNRDGDNQGRCEALDCEEGWGPHNELSSSPSSSIPAGIGGGAEAVDIVAAVALVAAATL